MLPMRMPIRVLRNHKVLGSQAAAAPLTSPATNTPQPRRPGCLCANVISASVLTEFRLAPDFLEISRRFKEHLPILFRSIHPPSLTISI